MVYDNKNNNLNEKIVINFECFGVVNINGVEEYMSIVFGDNKASIQLEKGISNTRKIKYINMIFHNVKDKSQKDTVLL